MAVRVNASVSYVTANAGDLHAARLTLAVRVRLLLVTVRLSVPSLGDAAGLPGPQGPDGF